MRLLLKRFLLVCGCLILLGMASGAAQAATRIVLQLKWTHAFQFAGYYIAQEKGYYRDAGLDVEIREANPSTNVVDEVVSGHADFGVGTSSLLLARKAGQPVVALAVIFQHSPLVLLTRAGEINRLSQLADKTVMLEHDAEELMAYLKREKVPLNQIRQLPHRFDLNELANGQVDAISAYLTTEPYWLKKAGLRFDVHSPRAVGIDFYGDNLFTSERQLNEFPERVAAFREASLKGWEYALAHEDEAIDLILQRYPEALSREFLTFEADQMRPLLRNELVGIGYMHPERWRHIADTYAELGMLPRDFSLHGFLYDADANPLIQRLYRYLWGAGGILLFLGLIVAYVVRMNKLLRDSQAQQARQAAHLGLQAQVLDKLNCDESLELILTELILGFESHYDGLMCSIVLLDDARQRIRRCVGPSLPSFYNNALVGLAIGDGTGSCGTAAYRGERVIVEDIRSHPYWAAYQDLVRQTTLRSCWSEPVKDSNGLVMGTFAVYQAVVSAPSSAQLLELESLARLAALAIERARTRFAEREKEALFRLIAENSTDVIWTMELPSLRFSYVSPSVIRLRGWSAEEVMQRPLVESLTDDAYRRVTALLAQNLERIAAGDTDARYVQIEIEQRCKDGSMIPTETAATILVDDEGTPLRVVGITRDITERKRHEAELEQHRQNLERMVEQRTEALVIAKEAAEVASRAKSQFISNISHELRTPMNGIMGLGHVIRRRIHDPEILHLLDRQHQSETELLTLINNLIEVANINTGDPDKILINRVFSLENLLESIVRQEAPVAREKGLSLRLDFPEALRERTLNSDPMRVGQVLCNMIDNAIKFSEHGEIVLAVSESRLENQTPAIRFTVIDQGIGIAPEFASRIFSLFEQGDGSSTRKYGGTGLGLALCRQLVEMMGGSVGIHSVPGAGTTIYFTIPAP